MNNKSIVFFTESSDHYALMVNEDELIVRPKNDVFPIEMEPLEKLHGSSVLELEGIVTLGEIYQSASQVIDQAGEIKGLSYWAIRSAGILGSGRFNEGLNIELLHATKYDELRDGSLIGSLDYDIHKGSRLEVVPYGSK